MLSFYIPLLIIFTLVASKRFDICESVRQSQTTELHLKCPKDTVLANFKAASETPTMVNGTASGCSATIFPKTNKELLDPLLWCLGQNSCTQTFHSTNTSSSDFNLTVTASCADMNIIFVAPGGHGSCGNSSSPCSVERGLTKVLRFPFSELLLNDLSFNAFIPFFPHFSNDSLVSARVLELAGTCSWRV